MDHRPKYIRKTIKLLEDKVGENLSDLVYDNDFLEMAPKEREKTD
jgi:hypothetical protein